MQVDGAIRITRDEVGDVTGILYGTIAAVGRAKGYRGTWLDPDRDEPFAVPTLAVERERVELQLFPRFVAHQHVHWTPLQARHCDHLDCVIAGF